MVANRTRVGKNPAMAHRIAPPLFLCLLLLLATACGNEEDTPPPPAPRDQVRVLASSSLRGLLDRLKVAYEAEHPLIQLDVHLGDSNSIVSDVSRGDHADLVIIPDGPFLESLDLPPVAVGQWMTDPMVVVRPSGSMATLRGVAEDGGLVAVGNTTLPLGADTRVALRMAELYQPLETRTLQCLSAENILERVMDGTAAVGILYAAQASESDLGVEVIGRLPLPDALERRYVIATLTPDGEPTARWLLQDVSVGLAAADYGLLPTSEARRQRTVPE